MLGLVYYYSTSHNLTQFTPIKFNEQSYLVHKEYLTCDSTTKYLHNLHNLDSTTPYLHNRDYSLTLHPNHCFHQPFVSFSLFFEKIICAYYFY
ncbi:hypothetical protein BMR1_03g01546 [Babesia microti strain RI]|uniref:Uncharacterized protein n=1 Tax=Babesia microti (strain RI) TaxID=1133968 RepID=A0A1R4ABG7_BABMR|nr:hypothetical protein BMR1_03g01546 [Babesia microti strain RI]SJK86357.1 hypothetical protein BMR1_03g01546 [Babesia microti strain RI]|eukprot:XP_021338524.1 hypothetical protein BMR1_03g01546 [Babesia microti strain RI]